MTAAVTRGEELSALAHGARRRVLQIVLIINLVMFFAELGAGVVAKSTALMADSLDMLGDARHRDEDVNMSSTFECSRNDVITNCGVLLAAGVWFTGRAWPDIVVGCVVAILLTYSAIKVIRDACPRSGI